MQKVVHLIPYDGIGGVEAAARTMADVRHASIDFRLRYLFPEVQSREHRGRTFNLLQIWAVARALAAESPDVLIVSLWRSAIAGILVRLFNPRVKLVVFLHNSVDAHRVDFLVTRLAMALSHEVWSDSEASVARRFRSPPKARLRTISFLAHRIEPDHNAKPMAPSFAYWGRLSAQKNLSRALKLFSAIRQQLPDATYLVIGPDGDEAPSIKALVQEMGLTGAVRLTGPLPFADICEQVRGTCFYLQTSVYEGMAMSVVEAMQLGLVPVVTPVGEIAAYCRSGDNAVMVDDDERAVGEVLGLLANPDAYEALRQRAIHQWLDKPLYRESVLAACEALLQQDRPK
jgi:glycosyltransferase involved in cell wall biosynthesis